MTPILDGSNDGVPYSDYDQPVSNTIGDGEFFPAYPTDWHTFDVLRDIESRQLSADTFEIRDKRYTMVLDLEGYNLFRDDSPQGQAIFDDWMVRNDVHAFDRIQDAKS